MKKFSINPTNFTPAMGAYSHGMVVELESSKIVFVTGQIALDENGSLVSTDIEVQTEYVFQRIIRILGEAGCTIDDTVKVQIFLTDIADFSKVSPIRNKYLSSSKPVSTLIEVSKLVRDGCKIEVEAIAIANIS